MADIDAVLKVFAYVEREEGFLDVSQVEDDAGVVFWEARCEWPLGSDHGADEVMAAHGPTALAAVAKLAEGLR